MVSFVFDSCLFFCFLSFLLLPQKDTRRNRITTVIRPKMVTTIVLVRFQLSVSGVCTSCVAAVATVAAAAVVTIAVWKKDFINEKETN